LKKNPDRDSVSWMWFSKTRLNVDQYSAESPIPSYVICSWGSVQFNYTVVSYKHFWLSEV